MRNTLIIFALTIFSSGLFAQDSQSSGYSTAAAQDIKPVRLGFVAAPALTWLQADNRELDSKGVRAGFAFGVLVDFTIAQSENYAFSTGLLMNMQDGGKLNYANVQQRSSNSGFEQVDTRVNLNLQYVQVPLTLKLKTNQIGYMSYFGQLGILGGLKLSARENGEYQYESIPTTTVLIERENANDDTQLFNAGMLVGIGTEYNISGNTNLVFGLSYFHGFTNVLRRNVVQTNDKGEVLFDQDGQPLLGSKRRAVLRNISLNIGVIF